MQRNCVGSLRTTHTAALHRSWIAAIAAASLTWIAACSPGTGVEPGIEVPPPPRAGEWHRILADTSIAGDVMVPSGERWLIGAAVRIAGNLRTVGGTIAMRPGSSLYFLGADRNEYIGGGMTYEPKFARDIGLWIGPGGVLDIQGTPKTGWNRTGQDPTWKDTDEYWIAPTARGDYQPKRWYPGQPIPQAGTQVPAAEVINVTRDVLIEGPGHIHIHSDRPQRIEYVTLRRMGILRVGAEHIDDALTTGRYALHLHHGGHGSTIRGVAAVRSEGRVFVPHQVRDVTLVDNVSVNSWGEAFWWDLPDMSHNILIDRLAVSGVHAPRSVTGVTSYVSALTLSSGTSLTVRNTAVSGASGSKLSNGFHWSSSEGHRRAAVWSADVGIISHNNEGAGIRYWLNDDFPHHVRNAILYRNAVAGVANGAYRNANRYSDLLLVDNGISHHSSSAVQGLDGGPARYEKVRVYADEGPALRLGPMVLAPALPVEFVDCTLQPGPGAPKVALGEPTTRNPVLALFRRCNVTPEDFHFLGFPPQLDGSTIRVEHEDGRIWEITVQGGQRSTREIK